MNIDQIRKSWVCSSDRDINASIEMWNSASGHYREKEIPGWETDPFLGLLDDSIPISHDMTALDVGCGAGSYSIALAGRIKKSVGIDLSPDMIRYAREKAEKCNAENIEFICDDWNIVDVDKEKYRNSFDIVFAHMTPAICSAETFEKMIACSKKYCVMAKPTRRKDSVLDEVKKLAGLSGRDTGSDEAIPYVFDILWQSGYCPKFYYRNEVWEASKTLEEADAWYIGRVRTFRRLLTSEEARLKEYLRSIAVDGKIYETITTTVVTVYWEK